MTEEKAISLLCWLEVEDSGIYNRQWYHGIKEDLEEALEMAISALEQQLKDKELAAEVVENARKIKEPCITETEMEEYIKKENPKLILSSVDEDEYKDVLKEPCITSTDEPMTMVYPTIFCEDAISREAVQEAFAEYVASGFAESVADFEGYTDIIMTLPSVTPSRPKGHWIDKDLRKEEYVLVGKCSVCGQVRVKDKFCSNCGAKMFEPQESEDKG